MNIFSRITQRTMRQSRSRTIVTIIGVVLSTAMIAAVTTFGASIQQFLIDGSKEKGGDWHIMLEHVPEELKTRILEDGRVDAAGDTEAVGYADAGDNSGSSQTPYFYVESYSGESMKMVNLDLSSGRLPENDSELLVPSIFNAYVEEESQLLPGDSLTLELGRRMQGGTELGQDTEYQSIKNEDMDADMLEAAGGEENLQLFGSKDYTIVGIYDTIPWSNYNAPGYDLITGPGEIKNEECRMILRLKSVWDVQSYVQELKTDWPEVKSHKNSDLLRWYGIGDNENFIIVILGLMGIAVCLIMAASISLIYNAFSISMRERTGQFGMLSSVGATKKQLRKALRFEAWSVSAVGIPLGLLSGVLGIGITLHFIGPILADWMYGREGGISLKISWIALGLAAVIALATVQISVWLPARRLKKISPLEAIRSNEDIRISSKKIKSSGLAGKLFGLEGTLASKNYRRDKRKYRATVVSLTLSIVLFVTAGAYVLYLSKGSQEVFQSAKMDISVNLTNIGCAPAAGGELAQIEGIEEIYEYQRGYFALIVNEDQVNKDMRNVFYARGDGKLVKDCYLQILPDSQFREYAKEVGADPEAYIGQDRLKGIYKDTVRILDPETQKYHTSSMLDLQGGEVVELCDSEALMSSEEQAGEIKNAFSVEMGTKAEVYPKASDQSYTSYIVTLVLAQSTFEKAGQDINKEDLYQHYSLKAEDHKAVAREIQKRSRDDGSTLYQCDVYDMREHYEKNHNILVVVQVLTTGFVVLMSLIAMANIFNTISTNLYLRRREFAMLRSIGMTQKGFRKMMGCECLIYGLRSICYGVLLSAGTSYLVYRSLQSGVEFAYTLPWLYWLIAIIVILAVVGITMVYTMKKMAKDDVIEILKQSE